MGVIQQFLSGRGAAADYGHLRVGSMASGMAVTLPYVALRGARPGRTLWLHGQVHGDEINGMVAALRFANSLDPAAMSGNLVVTPTGNPQALDARRKRNPYDELDLDQTYPGSAGGLISQRLAHVLIGEIRGTADMVINLHTMNPLFDSRLYTVYKHHPGSGISEQALLDAMALFHPNVACRQDVGGQGELPGNIAGALDFQCQEAGIAAFMLELGGGSRYEAHNVAAAEAGFARLAAQMGIVDGAAQGGATRVRRVTRRGWLTFEHGGLFVPEAEAGATLARGAVLGAAMDLHGKPTETIALPQDGIVIGLRRDPVVHTGERAAFVAYEWDEVACTVR
ncbi:M14 family metallopeptidase [Bordetella trematum]|uniref:M14 family metallopeptidase n=1 Tax=Bordetella trematum TaxID=123899 RepID=UPI0015C57C02|nr:M14 family metallopeptidase [Bordetella trematum]